MFEAMMPEVWTDMLYRAAETVRERTVLLLREVHPTWIGCAEEMLVCYINLGAKGKER